MFRHWSFALALPFLAAMSTPAFGQPSFQGLGDLPGGSTFSSAWDVSADDVVVVGRSGSTPYPNGEASRWESGVLTGLGVITLGDARSIAFGVSADGEVIAGRNTDSGDVDEAFRWTDSGGMVGLGNLPGGGDNSQASAVSADGTVIVGQSESSLGTEPFRWEGGVMTGLGLPSGSFGAAHDVSADGSVVVGHYVLPTTGSENEAFRWENGVMVGLGDFPGGIFYSYAYGVSADGMVIVGESDGASGAEACRWANGVMEGLGDLPGGPFSSSARAVSPDGSIVVGLGRTDLGAEAFIWDQMDGMRSLRDVLVNDYGLDLTGWTLTQANAVSNSATELVIAGIGVNSGNPNRDGDEGWLATIPLPDCNENSIPDLEETDSDGDGFIDDCDSCPNYPNPIQSLFPRADVDQDCDVDGVDFSAFASCYNGAGNSPRTFGCPPANATAFDFFGDNDVDGIDFATFASCYNGAGNPPGEENCPE